MAIDSASNTPNMVVVHTFKTESEAGALETLLRENGIQVSVIRRSHDSAFDGLMLSPLTTDAILVPEKDLGRAKGLIDEYLQSIPSQTGDDDEDSQWKRDLISKRLRVNRVGTWIMPLCLTTLGLWAIIKWSGVGAKLFGSIMILLAMVCFCGLRERCRQDQRIVSGINRKPE